MEPAADIWRLARRVTGVMRGRQLVFHGQHCLSSATDSASKGVYVSEVRRLNNGLEGTSLIGDAVTAMKPAAHIDNHITIESHVLDFGVTYMVST